ncbi:serine/threonine-protein kinase [Actinomadura sp. 9N407]|uniref:serine/threonine-protein kinase n=1 Tax=Actinomadura sp. 9N407 TaxID=3375154 RepID=UPI0037BD53C9
METGDLPARATPPRPDDPRTIGPYAVVGSLGGGGMGRVFLGRGTDGALVAIKVVRDELAGDPEFRARFRREAHSAMRVPRFCTAEVIAADPGAPEPYLVTEYIDGPTLEESVQSGGPLRGADLDQLGVSIAAALVGIHAAGIIHRDLKPANVLLSRVGARVIDFGVAGAVDATRLTGDGMIHGTPAYMAPEQLQAHPVPASDVFAWGGVMLYAATGRRPFGGATLPVMAIRIMQEEPDLTGLTGVMYEAVAAALSKDAAHRPSPAGLLELLGVAAADTGRPDTGHADTGHAVRTRLDLHAPLATRVNPMSPHRPPAEPPPDSAAVGPTLPGNGSSNGGHNTEALPEWWQTTWTPPPPKSRARRRRRRWALWTLTVLVSAGLIGAAAGWSLREERSPDFVVTGVNVHADEGELGCDSQVDVTGVLSTNGASGRIVYQWKRSDQKAPDPPREQEMPEGQEQAAVHLTWDIEGPGTRTFTATLTVLNGTASTSTGIQDSTSFRYSCKE